MKKVQIICIICLLILSCVLFYAWAEQEIFIYNGHGKRDPFWTLVSPSGNIVNYDKEFQATDLKIEGIISDSRGQNVAIINGQIVKKGDLLGTWSVTEIQNNLVILNQGDEKIELKLNREE